MIYCEPTDLLWAYWFIVSLLIYCEPTDLLWAYW